MLEDSPSDMSVECLDLADFLLIAEQITGIEVAALARLPRLHMAEHALSFLRARDRNRTCDLLLTRRKKQVSASTGPYQKRPLTCGFAIRPCHRLPVDNAQFLTVR